MTDRGAALVTGGSVRIGRAIVERLARDGYAVAIHANRSVAAAEQLAAGLRAHGSRVAVVRADLAEPADVDRLIGLARLGVGDLTLLVNNASEFEEDHLGGLTRERWNRHFRVNVQTPCFLTQDFAAQAPSGSAIVNIIDQRIDKLTPQFFSYTLTKSALATATVTMAQALAPRIRVNGVSPGPSLTNARQGDEDFGRQVAATPLGIASSPEMIAEAVAYLAGAKAVTGAIIPVDAGQRLVWQTPDVHGIRE